jgi:hypothetical protein
LRSIYLPAGAGPAEGAAGAAGTADFGAKSTLGGSAIAFSFSTVNDSLVL